jgi:hypothetical protein
VRKSVLFLAVMAVHGWSWTAASAQVGIDFRGAWINGPLGSSETAMVAKYPNITTAFVMKSADDHVFDEPKLFPKLRNVALEVGSRNVANLKALSINHPQLRCITIRQSEPLSDEAVSCLAKFTSLKSLELACPVATPSRLLRSLPSTLEQLEFRDSNLVREIQTSKSLEAVPKVLKTDNRVLAQLAIANGETEAAHDSRFPCLREITIERGSLGRDLLQLLYSPELRSLCLYGVNIEDGALRSLVRFKKLSSLNLAGTSLPEGEYAFVRSLPLRIVNSDNARQDVHTVTNE